MDGRDVTRLGGRSLRAFRRAVGIVFQNPFEAFDPRLGIAKALERPLAIHQIGADGRERRRIIAEALAAVGLVPPEQFLDRLPREVSGGQLQRIAIVRATLTMPRLLIADEPISMLDASLRRGILDLLRDLRDRRGTTVLLITHDLAAARAIADRIAVLDAGRLVELWPGWRAGGAPAAQRDKSPDRSSAASGKLKGEVWRGPGLLNPPMHRSAPRLVL